MFKRLKFFFGHLLISLLISLLIIGFTFFIWYPAPLATSVGVKHIFLMMLVIDVIIGPILGFLVYKEGKRSLKFDIGVIILLQISALLFGIYSIAQGRPAWLVFNVDRFELVRQNEIIDQHINDADIQFQQASWLGPEYVSITQSSNFKQRQEDMFLEVLGGISTAQQPERYEPLSSAHHRIKQSAQNLALLSQYNAKADVQTVLAKYPQANAYLPLKANAVDMTVLINKDTAEIIKIVDLRPWK
ncbi:type IV pilin accessory protein [Acinetobacter tandoii]|uniref:TfpX/TfpZ family type IV pilin accessory protein n=1 Tax=Acinetobacter tandoii TaxID=202954 RepID=UPI000C204641|nr:TfpX/TfpZ family type IV pilin accessory protein [Acinetobacter tandoii]PJG43424.1 type IV pilin accessory protein [Acinetobacter tandoii]